jgi:hypothetical protein
LNLEEEQKRTLPLTRRSTAVGLVNFHVPLYPPVNNAFMQAKSINTSSSSNTVSSVSYERAIKSRLQERRVNPDD